MEFVFEYASTCFPARRRVIDLAISGQVQRGEHRPALDSMCSELLLTSTEYVPLPDPSIKANRRTSPPPTLLAPSPRCSSQL
jgi:hypothetical protein